MSTSATCSLNWHHSPSAMVFTRYSLCFGWHILKRRSYASDHHLPMLRGIAICVCMPDSHITVVCSREHRREQNRSV